MKKDPSRVQVMKGLWEMIDRNHAKAKVESKDREIYQDLTFLAKTVRRIFRKVDPPKDPNQQ